MSVYLYQSIHLWERGRTFTYDLLWKQVITLLHVAGTLQSICNTKNTLVKKKKNPSNFFRDNRSFSKTIHQINRSLFCLLMSKLPPQISLTYCTCSPTLSISPFCACIWGSTDSCHLQKVFYLTGMHRIHLVKHIRKRRRVSTRE